MPIHAFPPLEAVNEDGVLALGGDLHPKSLLLAYGQGIFPWPIDGLGLAWFHPDPRAVLNFADLHIPKSLAKFRKKCGWSFSVDRAFAQVIRHCAMQPRPGQDGTWITPDLFQSYIRFHEAGYAHSVEVWEGRSLIGGLYGVAVQGVFSAESMFHLRPNASKLALLHLHDVLAARGLTWIDIQVMTPHMKALGAKEISRKAYLRKLHATQKLRLDLF